MAVSIVTILTSKLDWLPAQQFIPQQTQSIRKERNVYFGWHRILKKVKPG